MLAKIVMLSAPRLQRFLPVPTFARHLRLSGLFDREWYLRVNPDLAGSTIDPLKHFIRWGEAEGRDPNPLFDTSFYLERNPDVAASGINPLLHFLLCGAGEGRDPNPMFDTSFYLASNPDVAAGGMNPLLHYLRSGSAEGRDPSPAFDTSYYARQNPDAGAAGMLPLAHYLAVGRDEGRAPKDRPEPAAVSRLPLSPPTLESGASGRRVFVVGLAMVKDAEDIIEAFVRHNLQFLDALFLADNDSTDETRTILVNLQREGLPIAVFDDPILSYLQSEKMTHFIRGLSATVFPDFIVPIDNDEFIRCESREHFISQLERIPAGCIGRMPWVTYVVTPTDLAQDCDDPLRLIRHRRREEKPPWEKAILRLDRRYSPSLVLTQGNHDVLRADGAALPSIALEGVALAHFPVRSAEQLTIKAVVGWMSFTAKDRNARKSSAGFQWREAFDLVLAQGEIPRSELPERSMLYAQEQRPIDWSRDVVLDPMPFTYVRRYGKGNRTRVLSMVAKSWEKTLTAGDTFGGHLELVVSRKRAELERAGVSEGRVGDTSFDASWHLTHPFVDIPPYRYLAERFRPASVLDVGCGLGANLLFLHSMGAGTIMGIDGFPESDSLLPEGAYAQRDLSQAFDAGGSYDLVVCTEVAEHLPAAAADALPATLARHARDLILFSAAEDGQPGVKHITCRPIDYWLERWRELGWEPDVFATLTFRSLSTLSWLRRNPVILRRAVDGRHPESVAVPGLAEIGERCYRWYSQEPKVYDYPFTEDPPEDVYPEDRFGELYRRYRNFTMIPEDIFTDNLRLIEKANEIDGCVVECGVWRSGMIAAAAELLGNRRDYYLFDSFEGLPPAQEMDGQAALDWQKDTSSATYYDNCRAEIAFAESAMKRSGARRYTITKGWFDTTLPEFKPSGPIAVLRLDSDWYSSTKQCLESLYPHVAHKGIIIIDDYYTWDGCAKAVHEYLSKHQLSDRICRSSVGVCYIVKN